MKVTFLRPAPPGIIRGFGRMLQRGRSILFAEAELRDPKGNMLARASATLRVVPALSRKRRERLPQTG
jgi:acyl-coenzyme A thioesterase PaaI-like protein